MDAARVDAVSLRGPFAYRLKSCWIPVWVGALAKMMCGGHKLTGAQVTIVMNFRFALSPKQEKS